MIKINPVVNNIKLDISKIAKTKQIENTLLKPIKPALLGFSAAGIIVSSFFKDYRKTEESENYYQFKIDEKTGSAYKPDEFQRIAGMNLYLGNDVIVTAPTGTGKTAIAEYIITKNLKEGKKTFYTTPLKALSNEKFLDFSKIYGEKNVGLLTGDHKIEKDAPIIVMTTEVYKNMVDNRQNNFEEDFRQSVLEGLNTVIFDELQYLGDIDRGGVWEQSIMFTPADVQILALSATVGNNEEINDWIASTKGRAGKKAEINKLPHNNGKKETVLIDVPAERRHVPLYYEVVHAAPEIKSVRGGTKKEKILAKQFEARKAQTMMAKPREDFFKELTKKLKAENKLPAIYFVFSRKEGRHLLKYLSNESEILTTKAEQKEIEEIIEKFKNENKYLGESLNFEALKKGYVIHNAGLLPTQKRLMEELSQKKLVKVIIATETLSAGINMPVKTTVITTPRKPSSKSDGLPDGKINIPINLGKQMLGRAGRRGIDTEGFCFLVSCNAEQTKFYNNLIESPSAPLESNLELDYSFVTGYIAEFADEKELEYILSRSLYVYDKGKINYEKLNKIKDNFLIKKEILSINNYVDKNGKLTTKGHLIKHLNGYEQIPIINVISNGSLINLNPVQIAGIVGGLANIECNIKGDIPQKPFEMRNNNDIEFIEASEKVYNELDLYARKTARLYPDKELVLNPKPMQHLYKWADLNNSSDDAKRNWRKLYYEHLKNNVEEGVLHKEISKTEDLLKQLIDVCQIGVKYSDSVGEKDYYKLMKNNFQEALNLIQKGSHIFEL